MMFFNILNSELYTPYRGVYSSYVQMYGGVYTGVR